MTLIIFFKLKAMHETVTNVQLKLKYVYIFTRHKCMDDRNTVVFK